MIQHGMQQDHIWNVHKNWKFYWRKHTHTHIHKTRSVIIQTICKHLKVLSWTCTKKAEGTHNLQYYWINQKLCEGVFDKPMHAKHAKARPMEWSDSVQHWNCTKKKKKKKKQRLFLSKWSKGFINMSCYSCH